MAAPEDVLEFTDNPRAIRIRGHRIWIEHVLEPYRAGAQPDAIARAFPSLTIAEIEACIAYYQAHTAEMDDYLLEYRELGVRMQAEADAKPSPVVERLRRLKRALHEAEDQHAHEISG